MLNSKEIIIGSRGSDLALWQARYVQKQLKEVCHINSTIKIIKTKGDQIQHLSFDKIEGKGFFTKEIEEALLCKEIDLAVHSFKDLETTQPKGLCIAAVSKREDPSDILLINKGSIDKTLYWNIKQNAALGTSSSRRKSQILMFRPDIELKDIRGNVPTRIEKLRQGLYDAILLAKAGLDRLNLDVHDLEVVPLSPSEFIPAPAQGVLALQIREEDVELLGVLDKINNPISHKSSSIERGLLKQFGGGCQVPLGIFAEEIVSNKFNIRISKAKTAYDIPLQTEFIIDANDFSAENIVCSFNQIVPKNVFISKNVTGTVFEHMLTKYGFKVYGESLIETIALNTDKLPQANWIFFSSKNAVKYYLDKFFIENACKIGAVGSATAQYLHQKGYSTHFIGDDENTEIDAQKFSSLIKEFDKVLFPCSDKSIRTFQKALKHEQVIDFPVYQVQYKKSANVLDNSHLYIFTSPSNVHSFFNAGNTISDNAKIIAIGKKTMEVLEETYLCKHVICSPKHTLLSMAREVVYQTMLMS